VVVVSAHDHGLVLPLGLGPRQVGHHVGDLVGLTVFPLGHAEALEVGSTVTARGQAQGLLTALLERVAEMLRLEVEPAAKQALVEPVRAPGVYEFYLQGRGYLQRYDRAESLDAALAVLDQALARDPGYALAHAGKAEAHLRRYEATRDLRSLALARASAHRAIELDADLPAVQLTTGLVEAAAGDSGEAIRRFQRVLELEPGNADAHRELARAYDAAGRVAEAEATYRRAIQLRPDSWSAYKELGAFYNRHGRVEESLPLFQRVVELTPDNYTGYANLGGILLRLGRHAGWVEVTADPARPALRVRASLSLAGALMPLTARLRALFDLDARPDAVAAHLLRDARLAASLRRHPGLRVPGAFDGFEAAVRVVLGQQVTVKAATTVASRLVAALGESFATPFPGLARLAPTPEALLAAGESRIAAAGDGADVRSTAGIVAALGARVERVAERDGRVDYRVTSPGGDALAEPDGILDCGNSGTTTRLVAGLVAGRPLFAILDGDASLRRRPMGRVVEPLRAMGAAFAGRRGDTLLPIAVTGRERLSPIDYRTPVPSAQVKSAILLAALAADGRTRVTEAVATRDHTERMLRARGVAVPETTGPDGEHVITIDGPARVAAIDDTVPADPSGAAFWLVAGAIHPDAELRLAGVSTNPTRRAIIDILRRMGARLDVETTHDEAGEPCGVIHVEHGPLTGTTIEPDEIPGAIDELPILAMAASIAEGETRVVGADELRVKESDRIAALEQLIALGVDFVPTPDGFVVHGNPEQCLGPGRIVTHGDHRIAMAFAIAALRARDGITIDDPGCVDVSFPGFFDVLRGFGVPVEQDQA